MIEQAVADSDSGRSVERGLLDPYGMAIWPSALVLAQAVAAYVTPNPDQRILELGAGCGLASLTAARLGADVLATDFRMLPLQLLRAVYDERTLVFTKFLSKCMGAGQPIPLEGLMPPPPGLGFEILSLLIHGVPCLLASLGCCCK